MRKKTFGDNPLETLTGPLAKGRSPWDAAHPPVSYRLIPPEVHQRVLQVASQEGVPVGQVVAYALLYWLERYERGEAPLPIRESATAKREVALGT